MRILAAFITLILYLSCKSPQNEPELTQDFLRNKFDYLLDTTQTVVHEKSYLNDTANMSIKSLVILTLKKKIPKHALKKTGFQEFQQNIDTTKQNTIIKLKYPGAEIGNGINGDVILPIPIDNRLSKNLLMKKIELNLNEKKVVFYDTLANNLYFYHYKFYKPSMF